MSRDIEASKREASEAGAENRAEGEVGQWTLQSCQAYGCRLPRTWQAWHRDPKGIQAGMEWDLSLVLVRHHGIKEYECQAQHRDLNPLAFGLKAFSHSVVILPQQKGHHFLGGIFWVIWRLLKLCGAGISSLLPALRSWS